MIGKTKGSTSQSRLPFYDSSVVDMLKSDNCHTFLNNAPSGTKRGLEKVVRVFLFFKHLLLLLFFLILLLIHLHLHRHYSRNTPAQGAYILYIVSYIHYVVYLLGLINYISFVTQEQKIIKNY